MRRFCRCAAPNVDLTTIPRTTATVLDEPGIYPGKVLEARTVTVHNSGSLDGVLDVTTVPDTHGGQLQDQLTATVTCTSDDPAHAHYSRVDNNVVQDDSLTIRSTFTLTQAGYLD